MMTRVKQKAPGKPRAWIALEPRKRAIPSRSHRVRSLWRHQCCEHLTMHVFRVSPSPAIPYNTHVCTCFALFTCRPSDPAPRAARGTAGFGNDGVAAGFFGGTKRDLPSPPQYFDQPEFRFKRAPKARIWKIFRFGPQNEKQNTPKRERQG